MTFLKSEPNPERYTPPEIVAAVKETLGDIDLDPATTPLVNNTFIRAKRFYTSETNGIDRENSPWSGRVYINPPGNPAHSDGIDRPKLFWERLIIEYTKKQVTAGVFLAYNIEFLQRSQGWAYSMLHYPFCVPERQLVFYREKNGRIVPKDYPEFGNAVIYVGKNVKRFVKAFSNIGGVVIPKTI